MTEIGFLGVGQMGAAMALRLLHAGHAVHVWNRSLAATEPLVEAGAKRVATPEEALATGLAFSMLANDAAADATFSEATLRSASGTVHINMATMSTECSRALHQRHTLAGVHYAAAPVLGRPALAASGQLNIVASGSPIALERAAEFFPLLGKRMWNLGEDAASASLVKIAMNYNLIHAIQALAESVNLVERGGVDPHTFVEVLTDAAFTGSAYTGYGALIADRTYLPAAFSVELGMKDLGLAQSAATELSAALPTAETLHQVFAAALDDPELAELDWSAVAEITRRQRDAKIGGTGGI